MTGTPPGGNPPEWNRPEPPDQPEQPPQPPPGWQQPPPPPGSGAPPPGPGAPPPGYQQPGYQPPPNYGYQQPGYGYPAPGNRAMMGPPPSSNLAFAIVTTLLCCLPAGIVAIVYAAQVNSKWAMGDYDGAMRASSNAKMWSWISVGVGIVAIVGWFAIGASIGNDTNSYNNY